MPKRGAAVFLVYSHQVILLLRDDIPHIAFPCTWTLCAGGIEEEETPLQALKREIYEELRLRIDDDRLVQISGEGPRGGTFFFLSLTGQEVALMGRDEGMAHGFFSFSALEGLQKLGDVKGGLGGAIKKFMDKDPNATHRLVDGKTDDTGLLFDDAPLPKTT